MYHPHTEAERKAMLHVIGVNNLEDLFQGLPSKNLFPKLDLPEGITEIEAYTELQEIAAVNETTQELISFLGAGAYHHYIPAAVDAILRRGEFYTAYTPYQPEISQGTLQAIFEYQSLMTLLTGMDVSNASHYDGSTAVAEAVNMAYHSFRGKRPNFVISPALNPQARETLRTYTHGTDIILSGDEGVIKSDASPEALIPLIDDKTALVIVQYPDFFGRIYDYTDLVKAAHEHNTMVAVHVNPLALGLLKPPGDFDADIVTGEGQPLGIPLSFGGPYLGIFTTKEKYVRKMAGRIVGETVDTSGQPGYVLTLSTREQHIRRERATSNICTNQGLLALAAAVYLSLLGKHGLKKLAELNFHKAHYAAGKIAGIPGFEIKYKEPFFNEFTVRCPMSVEEINSQLLEYDILGGYNLEHTYQDLENNMLIAVTEMNSREDIDILANVLAEVTHA